MLLLISHWMYCSQCLYRFL